MRFQGIFEGPANGTSVHGTEDEEEEDWFNQNLGQVGGFPCGSSGKEPACNAGNLGFIPRLGRSAGKRNGYPLQYFSLENFMDCIVHGVANSQIQLSDFHLLSFF